ncbi:hypothetical protein QYF36_014599 [Acer negundo]|nr:hypothetical protein QYF36_014599 [Acer negundo]
MVFFQFQGWNQCSSGDSILECASIADSWKQVVAVGIIHGLILSVRKVTNKPVIIYPNSGETYDANRKEWVQSTGVRDEDFVSYIGKWRDAGGC